MPISTNSAPSLQNEKRWCPSFGGTSRSACADAGNCVEVQDIVGQVVGEVTDPQVRDECIGPRTASRSADRTRTASSRGHGGSESDIVLHRLTTGRQWQPDSSSDRAECFGDGLGWAPSHRAVVGESGPISRSSERSASSKLNWSELYSGFDDGVADVHDVSP